MSSSKTRAPHNGRDTSRLSLGPTPRDLDQSSDSIPTEEYSPSHPKFDRSSLSDATFIEQLMFENNELQAIIRKQDTWIDALTSQLRAHEIIPAVQRPPKGGNSFLPRRRPSLDPKSKMMPTNHQTKLVNPQTNINQLNSQPGLPVPIMTLPMPLPVLSQISAASPASSAAATDKFKRNPSNMVLDPKGGVHLSPRLASAAAAAAAIVDSTGTGTGSDSDIASSYFNRGGSDSPSLAEDDIPERSSRRRRESVRIDHPSTRFQEKEERDRLEKEELEQESLDNKENSRLEREAFEREVQAKAEQERKEKEEAERLEKLRLEKVEQARLQKLRQEKEEQEERERLEKERIEREKAEQDRLEQERLERERHERERLEIERLERERIEKENLEKERVQREFEEKERQKEAERLQIEQERNLARRLEQEKIEKEQFEQEQLAREARELQEKLEQNVYPSDAFSNKNSMEDITGKSIQKSQNEVLRSSVYSEDVGLETVESYTSEASDSKASMNRNNSILSQEKNSSNSSFNSYKSRLRLPATLAQAQAPPPQLQPPQLQRQVSQSKSQGPIVQRQVSQSKLPPTSFLQQLQQQIHNNQQQIQQLTHHNQQQTPLLHSQVSQLSLPQYLSQPLAPPHYQLQASLGSPQSHQESSLDSLKPAPILKTDQFPSPSYDLHQYGPKVTTPINQTSGAFDRKIPYTPEGMQNLEIKVNDMNLSQDEIDGKSFLSSPQASAYPQSTFSPNKSEYGGSTNDTVLRTPSNQQQFYALDSSSVQSQNYGQNTSSTKQQRRVSDNGLESSSTSSFQVIKTPRKEEESNLFIRPEEFQTINIYVLSTIYLNPNRKSDDPCVTLSVSDKDTGKEMWRIRKTYSQLVAFDNEIRPIIEYFGLPLLPDRSLFMSPSPVKVDSRRNQLQNYFNTLFLMPHIPQSVLFRICKFLSLDFVNPLDDFKSGARKEGYLIRRYKGLGTSWKIRWCQVDGPTLEIYEAPGGTLLEQIRLRGAQIGRQSADSVAEEKGYRHAFLLMEGQKSSKLSNSLPKHFFCAESDEERDEWIDCLVEYNGSANDLFVSRNSSEPDLDSTVIISPKKLSNHVQQHFHTHNQLNLPGVGHNNNGAYIENQTVAARHPPNSNSALSSPVSMYYNGGAGGSSSNILDQDPNRSFTLDDSSVSNKDLKDNNFSSSASSSAAAAAAAKKLKKRSIFPFRSKNASSENHQAGSEAEGTSGTPYSLPYGNGSSAGGSEPSMQHYLDQMDLDLDISKSVFGREVEEAFKLSNNNYFGRQVPSIIYRCLDYLSRTGAVYEEGIFRLSGSASSIRQLKDLFNTKFDVDLFDCPIQPDIHTVAGLLKTYLRELPAPILGVGPFNDLKAIVNNKDKSVDAAKLSLQFRDYISESSHIDPIHFDICFAILKFLTQIIANSSSNRMNLRNVCIVFVPTLNISLEVLSTILIDFDCIFEGGLPVSNDKREVLDLYIPNF